MALIPEFRKHAAKRKGQTHCQVGHPFTRDNTREEVCVRGGREYVVRICKACERQRAKRGKRPTQAAQNQALLKMLGSDKAEAGPVRPGRRSWIDLGGRPGVKFPRTPRSARHAPVQLPDRLYGGVLLRASLPHSGKLMQVGRVGHLTPRRQALR